MVATATWKRWGSSPRTMAATKSSAPPTGMVAMRCSTCRRRAGSTGVTGS